MNIPVIVWKHHHIRAFVVRDLGVYSDAQLTMKQQVNRIARSCFFHLRGIRQVRRSLRSWWRCLFAVDLASVTPYLRVCHRQYFCRCSALKMLLHGSLKLQAVRPHHTSNEATSLATNQPSYHVQTLPHDACYSNIAVSRLHVWTYDADCCQIYNSFAQLFGSQMF